MQLNRQYKPIELSGFFMNISSYSIMQNSTISEAVIYTTTTSV